MLSERPRYAWLVVALLVPVALLNYLDRQMLASMKFSVMRDIPDIGLEAKWGTILATVRSAPASVTTSFSMASFSTTRITQDRSPS